MHQRFQIAIHPLFIAFGIAKDKTCLLYTSPSPRDSTSSRMPSYA
ncbi:hypothetical protein ACX3VG_22225 [Escherichia coli]